MCDLSNGRRYEEQGIRPCLIISTTEHNMCSDTVIAVPITRNISRADKWQSHVKIYNREHDEVCAMVDHTREVDQSYVMQYMYSLDDAQYSKVVEAYLDWIGVITCTE